MLGFCCYTFLLLLQCIIIDVETRGQLGKCIAIRTAEALALLQPAVNISKATFEAQLLSTGKARKSQQKFLHPKSRDTKIQAPSKGVGGNTSNQRCIILQQTHSSVNQDHLNMIREGTVCYEHINYYYINNDD